MGKPPVILDPTDKLIVDEVGPWSADKHERLRRYIDISRGARAKYVPPRGTGGAAYIELFSGPGKSRIRDTTKIVPASPLVAYAAAKASNVRFSAIYLNDLDFYKSAAVDKRIRAVGGAAVCFAKPADAAIDDILSALNPTGLHFAFLDPYNLEQLPFRIIEKLARLPRVDMLIHVSVLDLQRNLDRYSVEGGVLDNFAPGWRYHVDVNQSIVSLRAALLAYWLQKIRNLGTMPAQGMELVTGPGGQRLYWLVFVSAHELAQKLWNAIRDIRGQGSMEF
jgi:three-Cys-motif partner protein